MSTTTTKKKTGPPAVNAGPVMLKYQECALDYLDRLAAYEIIKNIRIPEDSITEIGLQADNRQDILRALIRIRQQCQEMVKKSDEYFDEGNGYRHCKSVILFFLNHPFVTPKFYEHIIWHEDIRRADPELYTIIEQKHEELKELKEELKKLM
jgi:hypothetical protein